MASGAAREDDSASTSIDYFLSKPRPGALASQLKAEEKFVPDHLCMFPWHTLKEAERMPEQDLIVRHHEVYPGERVNLTGLLRTLMSYEIRAKKELEFMWFAHPWLPLWDSVPPKTTAPG